MKVSLKEISSLQRGENIESFIIKFYKETKIILDEKTVKNAIKDIKVYEYTRTVFLDKNTKDYSIYSPSVLKENIRKRDEENGYYHVSNVFGYTDPKYLLIYILPPTDKFTEDNVFFEVEDLLYQSVIIEMDYFKNVGHISIPVTKRDLENLLSKLENYCNNIRKVLPK